MEHVEYVNTTGMDREEAKERLGAAETGVLSLADGREAYGIPLSHHYDWGDSVLFRLGVHDEGEKSRFVESTGRACCVVYDYASPERSWSVIVRGPVGPITGGDERFDVA